MRRDIFCQFAHPWAFILLFLNKTISFIGKENNLFDVWLDLGWIEK